MSVFKSNVFTAFFFCNLLFLIFGQVIFQFLNFHFHIVGITIPSIIFLVIYTIYFFILKFNSLKIKIYDFLFVGFLFYLIINYIFLGHTNNIDFFNRVILIILFPYCVGRFFGSKVSVEAFQIFVIILSISFLILIFEISQNLALLNQDRFILYDVKDDYGSGGSTQNFVSMIFGSAALISFASRNFKKNLLLHNFIFLTSICILVLFGSRSSTIAIILTVIITYLYIKKINLFSLLKILFILLIGFTIFILFAPSSRQGFFNESIQGEGSTAIRGLLFFDAWNLFAKSPFFGIGASNFGHLYSLERADFAGPHSLFLHILTELGIIGFLIFFLFVLFVIYSFKKKFKTKHTSVKKTLLPLFSLWIFLILDMQSYGNYFFDYQFFLFSGILISNIEKM